MKFYLMGIGGAGMSVLADLLQAAGHEVSGSDRSASNNTRRLAQQGIKVYIGQRAEQVPADAQIVISSAIKSSNPELQIAQKRSQPILHRSQALALVAGEHDFIAVAGAHGKTTTSAMLATALEKLGCDPSYAVGANLPHGKSGGKLGKGRVFVAEADESDGSFLNYRPRIAIVTNVEVDHLDFYGTKEKFAQAFFDFTERIVPGGLLITNTDDPGAAHLAAQAAQAGRRVWTYGVQKIAQPIGETHIHICPDSLSIERSNTLQISNKGFISAPELGVEKMELQLQVPGEHMLLNAAAAWAAGYELGVPGAEMAQALGAFPGAARRFELRGEIGGVTILDDYAHHPTEIAATLHTARQLCSGKLRVLFQPHLYSRTYNFAARFAQALQIADSVVVTSVYAARETPDAGAEGNIITEQLPGAAFIPDKEAAAREIAAGAKAGDFILTIGAGDVTELAPVIFQVLEANLGDKNRAHDLGIAAHSVTSAENSAHRMPEEGNAL